MAEETGLQLGLSDAPWCLNPLTAASSETLTEQLTNAFDHPCTKRAKEPLSTCLEQNIAVLLHTVLSVIEILFRKTFALVYTPTCQEKAYSTWKKNFP